MEDPDSGKPVPILAVAVDAVSGTTIILECKHKTFFCKMVSLICSEMCCHLLTT